MGGNDKIAGKAKRSRAPSKRGSATRPTDRPTDNHDLKAGGTGDQAAGHAQQAIGEAKEALTDVTRDH